MIKFLFLIAFFMVANIISGKINKVRPADWRGWFYDLNAYIIGLLVGILPMNFGNLLFLIFAFIFSNALVAFVLKLDPSTVKGPIGGFYNTITYFAGIVAGTIIISR